MSDVIKFKDDGHWTHVEGKQIVDGIKYPYSIYEWRLEIINMDPDIMACIGLSTSPSIENGEWGDRVNSKYYAWHPSKSKFISHKFSFPKEKWRNFRINDTIRIKLNIEDGTLRFSLNDYN